MPGDVIEFPRRHARASAASNVNKRRGASCPRRRKAASKTKNLSDGILRLERQLLTAAELVPQSVATAAVPPSASTMSSTVRSMPNGYSQTVNVSSPPGMEIVTGCELRFDVPMRKNRNQIIARLRAIADAEGITDAELCKRIGVRTSTWANFVSKNEKRIITLEVAVKLCDEFSVTLDWIYRGKTRGIPSEILVAERQMVAA